MLYAHRPIARRLLAGANELKTSLGDLRVISAEGLIGFKLQGLTNRAALDDLMAAVEVLCPTWPQRETFINTGGMLL